MREMQSHVHRLLHPLLLLFHRLFEFFPHAFVETPQQPSQRHRTESVHDDAEYHELRDDSPKKVHIEPIADLVSCGGHIVNGSHPDRPEPAEKKSFLPIAHVRLQHAIKYHDKRYALEEEQHHTEHRSTPAESCPLVKWRDNPKMRKNARVTTKLSIS